MVPLLTIGGRIAKGFDFLGYSFEPKGLSIAPKTLANFLERMTQLYGQGANHRRIGQYVRSWWRWVGENLVSSRTYSIAPTLLYPPNSRKIPPSSYAKNAKLARFLS